MRSPLPVISIDPYKAARIAQEVYNALGAPKHASEISFDELRHKKSLKDAFARFAPIYGVERAMPAFGNGHWASTYRAYLEQVRLLVAAYIAERDGRRFSESEKTLLDGEPISDKRQIPLFGA